jgi:hypothetical protein
MAKEFNSIFMSQCGIEGCKHPRVTGTAHCAKHATLKSRTHAGSGRTWIWIPLTGIPGWWCLVQASQLLGVSCEHVSFNWRNAATAAFTCDNADLNHATAYSWLSAPSGTVTGSALAMIGFALAMSAVTVVIVLWNRQKRRM